MPEFSSATLHLAVFKLKLQKSLKWKISTVSKVDDKNKDKTVKSVLMRSLINGLEKESRT